MSSTEMNLTGREKSIVLFDLETTGLGLSSDIVQIGLVRCDLDFKVKEVINEYFLFDKGKVEPNVDVSFAETQKANRTFVDFFREKEKLWRAPLQLWVTYNTSFDLNQVNASLELERVEPVNWGREITNVDRFNATSNLCAMKLVTRAVGISYSIPLSKAVEKYSTATPNDFKRFCEQNNILAGNAVYHDAMYDIYCTYKLLKENKAWLYWN